MIYFIEQDFTGHIKIGYSEKNPQARLKSLQTGSPYKLSILSVIDGDIDDEKYLHNKCKNYRLVGEWFDNKVKNEIGYYFSNYINLMIERIYTNIGVNEIRNIIKKHINANTNLINCVNCGNIFSIALFVDHGLNKPTCRYCDRMAHYGLNLNKKYKVFVPWDLTNCDYNMFYKCYANKIHLQELKISLLYLQLNSNNITLCTICGNNGHTESRGLGYKCYYCRMELRDSLRSFTYITQKYGIDNQLILKLYSLFKDKERISIKSPDINKLFGNELNLHKAINSLVLNYDNEYLTFNKLFMSIFNYKEIN